MRSNKRRQGCKTGRSLAFNKVVEEKRVLLGLKGKSGNQELECEYRFYDIPL